MKFARDEIIWTRVFNLAMGCLVASALALALAGCNGDSGGSSASGIAGSSDGGAQLTPSQQQFQNVVSQYNALPGYTLTSADIQTLSSQGLLQGGDSGMLASLAAH